MYSPVRWFLGFVRLRIEGASPADCLNRFTAERLLFWDIFAENEFSLQVSIPAKALSRALGISENAQCQASVIRRHGFARQFGGLLPRLPFLLSLLFTLVLTQWLSARVWFFSVEGNAAVPDAMILRAVAQCGVVPGTRGKTIVPQTVKDHVLAEIPELSWLTVRQNGFFATIAVREKELPIRQENRRVFCDVEASRPGILEEITVLDGSAKRKIGDTVNTGDLLISAYIDLETGARVTGAAGEVFARTWRDETVITPSSFREKKHTGKEITVRYLCIGKKQIKLSRDSGISGVTCDKITKTSALTLPGGLKLPIYLVTETLRIFESGNGRLSEDHAKQMLIDYARDRTSDAMIAGQILHEDFTCTNAGGVFILRGDFECREMIGKKVKAEIYKED